MTLWSKFKGWFYIALFLVAFVAAFIATGHCQTAVILSPLPQLQFFDQSGRPLAFGCVFTYKVASTTPLSTYTDYTGTVLNANPVILSAGGSANIWLQAGLAYTFKVKAAGGTNCALGSTLYTVDGIGGGATVLTTIVTTSTTPVFIDAAQIQLFTLTLTANATAQPMSFVGVTPPGIIYFQITQDGSGGHTFSWPANTIGGCTIGALANQVTTQAFVYNGSNATATGPCITGTGPAITAGSVLTGSLIDSGLSTNSIVCTDANKQLNTGCGAGAFTSITVNGQTIAAGGSGNVNAGAAAHTVALNQGAGAALTGVALSADQLLRGVAGVDPTATSLCSGILTYDTSTHTFSCGGVSVVSGNGYIWIGPILLQWFTSSHDWATNERSAQTESWPIAFPTACFNVQVTPKFDSPVTTNFQGVNFDVNSCSTTTVNIYGEVRSDGSADSSFHALIVGIGH